MDIRLKTAEMTIDGRNYKVCCNIGVLAEVQEMCGGKLGKGIYDTSVKGLLRWITAMVNDARDDSGEPPLTMKQIGRLIPMGELPALRDTVTALLNASLSGEKKDPAKGENPDDEGEKSKNLTTSQS